MTLGGEVDHGVDASLREKPLDERVVLNVAADEGVAGVPLALLQVRQVTGVGEEIEVDDGQIGSFGDDQADEVAADEPGSTGNQDRLQSASMKSLNNSTSPPSGEQARSLLHLLQPVPAPVPDSAVVASPGHFRT